MRSFHGVGILGSLVLVGLVGCSNAAREASRNDAPVAEQVMLSTPNQPAHVGTVLQGSYQYTDADDDSEKDTLKAWLRDGSPIEGANQDKYIATAQDSGKSLQYRVTPVAASGKSPGEAVVSSGITIENSAPVVTLSMPRVGTESIRTTGVGNELSVDIIYSDVDGDAAATAEIRWLQDDFAIPGATSSTYTVKREDINHDLVAEVTPLAQQGVLRGTAVRSQPSVFVINSLPVAQNVKFAASTTPVVVGVELTASYTYFDADGDPENKNDPTMQEWQWLRNGEPIIGANALKYTLTAADANARIQFTVMPHASKGNSPGEMVMTEAIIVLNNPPQAGNIVVNGASAGNAFVGNTLSASYTYSDLDLDPQGASVYRWLRGANAITGATSLNYTVTVADIGNDLVFEVTPVAKSGASPGVAVSSTTPIHVINSAPVAKNVTLVLQPGTPPTLAASYTYFDADGDSEGTSLIRWLVGNVVIAGAQGLTYIPAAADTGKTIIFEVTPRAKSGVLSGSATPSNGIVTNNSAPTATNVSISPSLALVNTQLTGNYMYSDTDGDSEALGMSIFEWSNGTSVIGSTKTYTVKAADAHKTLTFKITPVASIGTSPGAAVTSPSITIGNSAPSITGLTIISSDVGKYYTGVKLTASYLFQDPDLDSEVGSTYQWIRNGVPIGGATLQSYTVLNPLDINVPLTVQVTPKDRFALEGTPVVSLPITPVNLAPVASNVSLTGTAVVGQTLTVNYNYKDQELEAESGSTFRWLQNGNVPIAGATGKTYLLAPTDGGKTIAAEVTPRAATGTNPGLAVLSNSVSVAIPNTAPVASNVTLNADAAAAIAGTTLSASYTYFDAEGDPEGASTRRWLRNDVVISGAVGLTYIVTSADVGQSIVFEVTPKATSGILSGSAMRSPGIAINFTIGGTVSGLAAGASIVLLNGADQLIVSANGPFAFPPRIPYPVNGTPYNVTIQTLPANQPCTSTYGAGSIKGANVTNINVFCGPPQVARFDPGGTLVSARAIHTATTLRDGKVLVAGGSNGGTLNSVEIYDPTINAWSSANPMVNWRYQHTATLLLPDATHPDGQVLIAGGWNFNPLTSVELYDPRTNTWSIGKDMSVARSNHTATRLPDGQVLVVGGDATTTAGASAELYDPVTNIWKTVAGPTTARHRFTATLIPPNADYPNGQVLVVGGDDGATIPTFTASAEIYTPATATAAGIWTPAGNVSIAHNYHTATYLLPDNTHLRGQVLIVGGWTGVAAVDVAELYDPATATGWTMAKPMTTARDAHTATLLPSGLVLVAGGYSSIGATQLKSAELYNPQLGTWGATANLTTARDVYSATLLAGGQVLLVGGGNGTFLASTELYNYPGTWSAAASLVGVNDKRTDHTSTLLPNGQVLVVGGWNNPQGYFNSAQIYDPTTKQWAATGGLTVERANHTATLLPPDPNHLLGQVLITGGRNFSGYLANADLYDPATRQWSRAVSMTSARSWHTATYLPPDPQHLSGQVLVAGGSNGTAIANVEIYDPASKKWSLAPNLLTARTSHAAILLTNGKILVAGGSNGINGNNYLDSAELFDPAATANARKWVLSVSKLSFPRHAMTTTLLPNGSVVMTGGGNGAYLANTDIYDSTTDTFLTSPPSLSAARAGHTAVLLPTGKVLVSGGIGYEYLANSESYDPTTGAWSTIPVSLLTRRYGHIATLLANGTLLITGGVEGLDNFLNSAEIYW